MPATQPGPIVVDASALAADAAAIDLLARLQLAARRLGRRVLLRHASADLERLIGFVGLDGVLRVEPGRQAEEREEALGTEEERQLPDLPVR
jgi:anti-anti-sigma regulatory factor